MIIGNNQQIYYLNNIIGYCVLAHKKQMFMYIPISYYFYLIFYFSKHDVRFNINNWVLFLLLYDEFFLSDPNSQEEISNFFLPILFIKFVCICSHNHTIKIF